MTEARSDVDALARKLAEGFRARRVPSLAGVGPAELREALAAVGKAAAVVDPSALGALGSWMADVVAAGLVPASEVWFAPHEDVCGRIIRAFDEARASADVCVFTITDDRIANALIAAHKRGVRIRIASDDMKSGDLGSDIARIAKAGVAVRIDRTEAHMHHKFAVFDRRVLLNGSYNWTRSANAENQENCVFTTDATLVAAFEREFERVWDASAAW